MNKVVQISIFGSYLIAMFCLYLPNAYSSAVLLGVERNWIPTNGSETNIDVSLDSNVSQIGCLPFHRLSQKAIWVHHNTDERENASNADYTGIALPLTTPMHGPARVMCIDIYQLNIRQNIDELAQDGELHESLNPASSVADKNDAITELYNWVIGHEIAHCLNLPHASISSPNVYFRNESEGKSWHRTYNNVHLADSLMKATPELIDRNDLLAETRYIAKYSLPAYHNEQYRLVPDDIRSTEKTLTYFSTLPEEFSLQSTTIDNGNSNSQNPDSSQNISPDKPYGLTYEVVDGQIRLSWTDDDSRAYHANT